MSRSGTGFDTTSTTLMWWTHTIVAFPEVQHRAQAELDAVVGRARLPTYADAPRLPYVRAIIKEVLRWRPAVRLGLPHVAAEDDWYEGMFVQKARHAWPIYGIAITTGAYLVTVPMNSRQEGILVTTVNHYQAPKKRIRKVMCHLDSGVGSALAET
jgi:Cytochrome P450